MLRTALFAILTLTATTAWAQDAELIEKGWALFNDKGLSGAGEHSCATCHPGGGHTTNKNYVGLDVVPLDNEAGAVRRPCGAVPTAPSMAGPVVPIKSKQHAGHYRQSHERRGTQRRDLGSP